MRSSTDHRRGAKATTVATLFDYTVTREGVVESGKMEVVARLAAGTKEYDLMIRGRRAISRRLGVPVSAIQITGALGV